ncbi:signal peptidase I [Promicromonospora sp. NPDC052451]|uniref:signal peptidase I n=1 Tax=unclassified Promicromonospora TaxID=2647929 RepID=UPI0037CB93A8
MRTAARLTGRALAAVVVVVAGAALVLGVIVPRAAGATPFVVLTDSMEPTLPVGTLVVSRPVDAGRIGTGTVITYQLRSGRERMVTHRVVGVGSTVGGERTYVTQGDANDVPDVVPVRDVQVRGAVWYHVPYLGYVAGVFTGQRAAVGAVVAVLLLGYAGWQVFRAVRERSARVPVGPAAVGPGVADGGGPREGPGRSEEGPVVREHTAAGGAGGEP